MIKPPGAGRWWAASRDCSMSRRNGSGSLGVPAPRCAGQGQGQTVFLPSCEEGAGPRGDALRSCPSPWIPGAPGRQRPARGGRAHGAAQSTCRGEAAAVWQEGFAMMHFVLKWLLSPGRLLCLVPVFQPRGRQAGRQLMVADEGAAAGGSEDPVLWWRLTSVGSCPRPVRAEKRIRSCSGPRQSCADATFTRKSLGFEDLAFSC